MVERIFISYDFQDEASRDHEYAMQLVEDLQAAGADVVVDGTGIADDHFVEYLNRVLPTCQWLIYVQTPEALRSSRVQLAVNAALNLVVQKRMQGVFQVAAAPCDPKDIPPTWATLRKFDATQDYARALARLLLALNLGRTYPDFYGTPPPLLQSPASPAMTEDRPAGLPVETTTSRRLDPSTASIEEYQMDRPSSIPPIIRGIEEAPKDQIDRPKPLPQERRKRVQPILVSALLLLLILFVGGGFVYALPRLPLAPNGGSTSTPGTLPTMTATSNSASSATVTITTATTNLEKTYSISAVTGTPDASKQQVQARLLSSTTQPQSQTVNATGTGTTPASHATGTIVVWDISSTQTYLPAGTTLSNNATANISVQFNTSVTLPANGSATVSIHVVEAGIIGNIAKGDFYCCGGNSYNATNDSAFSGGQNAQAYTFVQQSDIDGAANTLEAANTPNPDQLLQRQVQSNERMIGSPQCKPNVTSDYKAGAKATSVTVTVNFTCTAQVYDHDGALALGASLLKEKAQTDLGANYNPVGNTTTTLLNATIMNSTISLTVDAKGNWVYQLSDVDKQNLAQLIAGKSQQDAQALLLTQKGVAQVNIQIVGGDGKTLPADPSLIKIQ